MWTSLDESRLDGRLRELLVVDSKLEHAIRTLHASDGVGLLFICHAVERVVGLSALEAKRSVISACPSEFDPLVRRESVCPTCRIAMNRFSFPHGHTQIRDIWACLRCKREEHGPLRDDVIEIEPEFTLVISWQPEDLSAELITTLRGIDQQLGELPAAEAVKKLRAAHRLEIGGLSHNDVWKIKTRCDNSGLYYEIK